MKYIKTLLILLACAMTQTTPAQSPIMPPPPPSTQSATVSNEFSVASDGYTIYYRVLSRRNRTVEVWSGGRTDAYSGSVTIPATVKKNGTIFKVVQIAEQAFYDCKNLTALVIPSSVVSIGSGAFTNCSKLTTLTIPASVKQIDSWAFMNCTNLQSIEIPEGVKKNGTETFFGCENLATVTLPESLTYIGNRAFNKCRRLSSLTLGNPDPKTITIDQQPFLAANINACVLYVPKGSEELYREAVPWNRFKQIAAIR